jgi:hypothetical protein
MRYEDMLADPVRVLRETCAVLGHVADDAALAAAVAASAPDAMRAVERTSRHTTATAADPSIPFVREAVAGSWQKALSPAAAERFAAVAGATLQRLGYPT